MLDCCHYFLLNMVNVQTKRDAVLDSDKAELNRSLRLGASAAFEGKKVKMLCIRRVGLGVGMC